MTSTSAAPELAASPLPHPGPLFHGLPGALVVQVRAQIPDPQTGNLALGRAVHAALTENFAQKLETREDLPITGVLALFREAWATERDADRIPRR